MKSREPSAANLEERVSVAPLRLPAHEQAELVSRMGSLSAALYESPLVEPQFITTSLREIPLRPRTMSRPGAFMNITSRASDRGNFSADIAVTDQSKRTGESHAAYTYDSRTGLWDVWSHPHANSPDAQLPNTSFVNLLDSQLPTGALESLYDTASDGQMIVSLLQGHFAKKARKKERLATYSTDHLILGGDDYAADRHTELQVHSLNSTLRHKLFIAATFDTSYGPIKKAYSYTTEHRHRRLHSAGGTIQLTGDAYIPQARLNAYALGDQESNHPLDVLHAAVDELRSSYAIPE